MKNNSSLITGLGLVLALAVSGFAAPQRNWSNWLENYYLVPDSANVVPAVYGLSRNGYFEEAGQPATAIGFLAAVFAQNPDKALDWMHEFRDLPVAHQRLVAAALWYSGVPQGVDHVRKLARTSNPDVRVLVDGLMAWEHPSLQKTPVQSQSSLDLQWGAFLGSGEAAHIRAVFAALGSEESGVGSAARTALAQKALSHPRVYEICQSELDRQPADTREELRTALLGH